MDKLNILLKDCCPNIDFEKEKGIVTGKLIDSMELVLIISRIEDEFGILIEMEEMIPENFDSLESIWNLVSRKKGQ